jgi:hypothetical protein
VLRKEDKRFHYKAVRQSAVHKARGHGPVHVTVFPAHLRIRKGEYIALKAVSDPTSWSLMRADAASCYRYFFYTLQVGDTSMSYPRKCTSRWIVLFNARLIT